MHLNAFIAKAGFCSRRKAAQLIKDGKVKVAGKIILEPWHAVEIGETVTINGKRLNVQDNIYLVVNKPKGVTVTLEDKFAAKKITDLIPKKFGRLYSVGRLDKDSRGLLILTNDGDLCYKLTHPKFEVEKEYAVTVKGEIDASTVTRMKKGIWDEGDLLKVKSASVVSSKNNRTEMSVVVTEGKKRHLRRLLRNLGLDVVDLVRVRVANLRLGNLPDGAYRSLKRGDIYMKILIIFSVISLVLLDYCYADGLDSLIAVGRSQGEIAKEYESETKSYERVKRGIENNTIRKGQSRKDIEREYGEPVISTRETASDREKWVYKPAASSFFKGPKISLFFDKDDILEDIVVMQ